MNDYGPTRSLEISFQMRQVLCTSLGRYSQCHGGLGALGRFHSNRNLLTKLDPA